MLLYGGIVFNEYNWSVHAQPGSYQTTQVVSIVNFGNGYVASCTSMSGDVASKSTTIREYSNNTCTKSVALDKTVKFTDVNKSIVFKHNSMPSVDTVYMKASLTYGNGSKASMAGTIRTNG